jgi:hypothetical protein
MADLSGLMSAVGMGMDRRQKEKDARQEGLQYIGEKIYRSKKDADDMAFKKTELNEQSKQAQLTEAGLNARSEKANALTRDTVYLNALTNIYGQLTSLEQSENPLVEKEGESIWDQFQQGMSYVTGINGDWYTPENQASMKEVYFDPTQTEKTKQDFETWLKSVPDERQRVVLRAMFERAQREQRLPEELDKEEAFATKAPRYDPLSEAFKKAGAKNAMQFQELTGFSADASGADRYLKSLETEETIPEAQPTKEISDQIFSGNAMKMPEFTRTRTRSVTKQQTDWNNLANSVKALLNSIYPTTTPEQKRQIMATVGPVITEDATEEELKAVLSLLNSIGGK